MPTNEESLNAVGMPSNHDLHKDEIEKLDRSFFLATKADSLMRRTIVPRDGDQSPVSNADAPVTGPAAAEVDSNAAKSPDQSPVEACVRLKTLADDRLKTPADTGDSGVTKVLKPNPAIPAAVNKTEEISGRLRLETPLLVASKLGEIFV